MRMVAPWDKDWTDRYCACGHTWLGHGALAMPGEERHSRCTEDGCRCKAFEERAR